MASHEEVGVWLGWRGFRRRGGGGGGKQPKALNAELESLSLDREAGTLGRKNKLLQTPQEDNWGDYDISY